MGYRHRTTGLSCDGHEHAGESLRIEAFMHQARQTAAHIAEMSRKHTDGSRIEQRGE